MIRENAIELYVSFKLEFAGAAAAALFWVGSTISSGQMMGREPEWSNPK